MKKRMQIFYRAFIWIQEQQDAFERLKRCLTSLLILAYPDFERPFILYTDVFSFALGAILSQKDDQKRERVIVYASRTLRPPERKYSATEVECLAVIWQYNIIIIIYMDINLQ